MKGGARGAWFVAGALGLVVFLVLLAAFRTTTAYPVRMYDEGSVLVSALRWGSGQLPYRDFDPVYGPLEPLYLLLVGPSVLALRLLRVLALGGVAAACVWLLRRAGSGAVAPLAAAAVLAGATVLVHPALCPLVLAGCALATWAPGRALAAGVCVSLAGLGRPEFGGLAGLAALAAVAVEGWRRGAPWAERRRMLGAVLLGATPGVLVYVGLLLADPGRFLAYFQDVGATGPLRVLPYPLPPPTGASWWWARVVFALVPPLATAGGVLALGWHGWRARRVTTARDALDPAAVYLTLTLIGLFLYGSSRSDRTHLFPAFVVGLTVAGLWAGPWLRRQPRARRRLAKRLALGVLLLVGGIRAQGTHVARAEADAATPLQTVGLRGLLGPPGLDALHADLKAWVDARAAPGEPVFVGLGKTRADGALVPDHTRIYGNDALLYALLQRLPATRQHCFVPGVTATARKQQELVAGLEGTSPAVVVLALDLFRPGPRDAPQPPGADLLDRYLQERYAPRELLGRYLLLERAP